MGILRPGGMRVRGREFDFWESMFFFVALNDFKLDNWHIIFLLIDNRHDVKSENVVSKHQFSPVELFI